MHTNQHLLYKWRSDTLERLRDFFIYLQLRLYLRYLVMSQYWLQIQWGAHQFSLLQYGRDPYVNSLIL